MRCHYLLLILTFIYLTGCTTTFSEDPLLWTYNQGSLPEPNISLKIKGLGPCTDNPDRTLKLNSNAPTTILTHGCFSSSGRFRALAEVFAFHGQQTACFTYDDRDSLMLSSEQLIDAVKQLSPHMNNNNITIIGHSQGGLITRKALIQERDKSLAGISTNINLVTISTPFNGIDAAAHCGSPWVQALTLGLIIPVCYAISGDKWHEITEPSNFIQKPGKLIPQVRNYLKIVTDENNTCRRKNKDGLCEEDDYVFSLAEQYFRPIDQDKRTLIVELPAGHVEIVGDHKIAPRKLISILQRQGYMKTTASQKKADLDKLLSYLYN